MTPSRWQALAFAYTEAFGSCRTATSFGNGSAMICAALPYLSSFIICSITGFCRDGCTGCCGMITLLSHPPGFPHRARTHAVRFLVPYEAVHGRVEPQLAAQLEGDVRGMAGDVSLAGSKHIGARLLARL